MGVEEYLTVWAIVSVIYFILPISPAFLRPFISIGTALFWPLLFLWFAWIIIVFIVMIPISIYRTYISNNLNKK